jgi:hypothetical protein
MNYSKEERNKALVLEAFDTVFNRSGNPMFGDSFPDRAERQAK